jgi:4a-hydroxytetrahydrobiopterin dehydratase
MQNLLDAAQLKDAQNLLPDWEISGESLFRIFVFKNFVEAFDFMTAISLIAEDMNHYPDWANVYNRVEVRLRTHDSNGVTALDAELALSMDSLFTKG